MTLSAASSGASARSSGRGRRSGDRDGRAGAGTGETRPSLEDDPFGVDPLVDPSRARRGVALAAAREARAGGAIARISGLHAIAAGALAIFAPLAIALFSATDTPSWTYAIAAATAAPLISAAAVALIRPLAPRWFAVALIPLALGAAWFAWATSAVLPATMSPAAPWVFAAIAGVALMGGRLGALVAALLAIAAGAGVATLDPPAQSLPYLAGQDENFAESRALISALSWAGATVALAATAWAAIRAWTDALPALRRPTIAARQALTLLADAGAIAGLRVSRAGVVLQAIGAPEQAIDLPREDLRGIDVKSLAHPDDLPQVMQLINARQNDAAEQSGAPALDTASKTAPKTAPTTATVRLRSRSGAFEWVEIAAAPAAAYPEPPHVAADEDDAILIVRARWRSGDAVASEAQATDAAFLAQINSQLRTSVKSIHGYTEILTNEIFGPLGSERYRDYAKLAHEDAAKTLSLVDELLDLAEIEAGRYIAAAELIDPVPLIDGAVRNLTQTAERLGVSLSPEFPPNAPYIRVDRRALRRALAGLGLDGLRRAQIGDQVAVKIDVEDGAVRFSVVVTRRETTGGAPRLAAPTASAPSFAAPGGPEEAGERDALRAAARLSRLVARSLVERMNGAIFFAPDSERVTAGRPLTVSEAIFETPRGVSAGASPAAPGALVSRASAAVGFAPEDEEALEDAERARRAAADDAERVNHPLFAQDQAEQPPQSAEERRPAAPSADDDKAG